MAFNIHNPNYLLSVVLAVIGASDLIISRFFLPGLLAKTPKVKPENIRFLSMALHAAAAVMFGLAFYFYHFTPLR